MKCTVVGNRHYSRDLEQGGLEIPRRYTFKGPPHEVKKIQKFFQNAVKIEVPSS